MRKKKKKIDALQILVSYLMGINFNSWAKEFGRSAYAIGMTASLGLTDYDTWFKKHAPTLDIDLAYMEYIADQLELGKLPLSNEEFRKAKQKSEQEKED